MLKFEAPTSGNCSSCRNIVESRGIWILKICYASGSIGSSIIRYVFYSSIINSNFLCGYCCYFTKRYEKVNCVFINIAYGIRNSWIFYNFQLFENSSSSQDLVISLSGSMYQIISHGFVSCVIYMRWLYL